MGEFSFGFQFVRLYEYDRMAVQPRTALQMRRLQSERRAYLLLYFNKEKETDDANKLKAELVNEKREPAHEKAYAKYFTVKSTPKRGTVVKAKQEAINAANANYGYFSLLSNEVKDPIQALALYRNKDVIEKAFGNLEDRLNFRRMEVSSEQA